MADNIMLEMLRVTKDDIPLCIFGSGHYEGITHYLQKNGYIQISVPIRF